MSSWPQRLLKAQGLAVILTCTPFLKVACWIFIFFGKSQMKALAGEVYRPLLFFKVKIVTF